MEEYNLRIKYPDFCKMLLEDQKLVIGREDGRYPTWLRARYGTVEALNEAYGTTFESFSAVTLRL